MQINLEKIKPSVAAVLFMCFANVFTAALSFFLLNRQLFHAIDIFKLIIISLSLGSAQIFINMLAFAALNTAKKEETNEEREKRYWTTGAGVGFSIFNVCLFVSYIIPTSLSQFYILVAIIDVVVIVMCFVAGMLSIVK